MADGRYTGRKSVEVLADSSARVHAPERIGPAPGMMVTVAEIMAPIGNTGTVYVGWSGASARLGLEAGYEVEPGAIITLENPKTGDDGNPETFDLYDLYLTAVNNGDAVMYFTW